MYLHASILHLSLCIYSMYMMDTVCSMFTCTNSINFADVYRKTNGLKWVEDARYNDWDTSMQEAESERL